MAQLALATAGAVVGGFIGGPFGARVGFAAGAFIGGQLFGPKPPDGPRLEDLSVQAASYGSPIAILKGTARLAGTLIWVKNNQIDENEVEMDVPKGLSSGPSAFEYSATFAVSLCEGPIDGVRRIWADTKLIYDISAGALADEIAAGGALTATLAELDGATIIVYTGAEDQEPDPDMEAALGAGNVPAYRGRAYIKFILPLANFANRIPNISAEVVVSSGEEYLSKQLTADGHDTGPFVDSHGIDPSGPFLYTSQSTYGLAKWDLNSAELVYNIDTTATMDANGDSVVLTTGVAPVADDQGFIYAGGFGENANPIFKFDAETGALVDQVGGYGIVGDPGLMNDLTYRSFPQLGLRFLLGIETKGRVTLIDANRFADGLAADPGDLGSLTNIVSGNPGMIEITPDLQIWYAENESDVDTLYKIGLLAGSGGHQYDLVLLASYDLTATFGGSLEFLHYYTDEDVLLAGGGNLAAKIDPSDGSVLSTVAFGTATRHSWRRGPVNGKLWDYNSTNTSFEELDVATMTVTRRYSRSLWGGTTWLSGAYIQTFNALLSVRAANAGRDLLFLPRLDPQKITLASVISDQSDRVGLEASDIDVSLVTDEIWGYPIRRQATARGNLEPLLLTHFVDPVEVDRKVKFVPRGGSSVITIDEDDLGAHLDGEAPDKLIEVIRQEVELPERLDVRAIDFDANYDPLVQHAKRPREAINTRQQIGVDTAEVMQADDGKRIAEKMLYSMWAERTTLRFSLPRKYAKAIPTDVATLTRGGVSFEARLTRIDEGPFLDCEAVAQVPASYVSSIIGAPSNIPTPVLQLLADTRLTLIDSTLLRDEDDGPGFYIAVWPNSENGLWPGTQVFKSSDGESFTPWEALTAAADHGVMLDALPDSRGTTWQRVTMQVRMVRGTLSSATELEVLNGANALLVKSGDEWEVVQFQTATDLGDGLYEISNLVRGQRGTEHLCDGHAIGDLVVVPTTSTIRRGGVSAEVDLERFYKPITIGKSLTASGAQSFTNTAQGLECYSSVHIEGTRDSSNNLTITWIPRTRLGGENDWLDGVSTVPVGEDSEAYEVDIVDGSGTVLRTIDGLTSPTATYAAADQTTDGITPGDSVNVEIYKMSATVGRGTVAEATI